MNLFRLPRILLGQQLGCSLLAAAAFVFACILTHSLLLSVRISPLVPLAPHMNHSLLFTSSSNDVAQVLHLSPNPQGLCGST